MYVSVTYISVNSFLLARSALGLVADFLALPAFFVDRLDGCSVTRPGWHGECRRLLRSEGRVLIQKSPQPTLEPAVWRVEAGVLWGILAN
jgi:hypothetical protein